MFLHGAGERGKDNKAQLRHGVADFVSDASQKQHPCFVLAPQCSRGVWWMDEGTHAMYVELVEKVRDQYPIDPDRIYVTGLSMGGYGTWDAIQKDPHLFAAAIPICGGGDPKQAARTQHIPIWAFHGGADPVGKPEKSRAMIEALRKIGAKPKLTEYPNVKHNSWSRTYRDRKVHDWLFAQRRTRLLKHGDRIAFGGRSRTRRQRRRTNSTRARSSTASASGYWSAPNAYRDLAVRTYTRPSTNAGVAMMRSFRSFRARTSRSSPTL